jgi:hypothetical protein
LRKKFVAVLGIPRGEFRPAYQLESLIPLESRRKNWLKMKDELGSSSLPDLARPVWLFSSLVFLSVLAFLIASIYARNHDGGSSLSFIFGFFVAMAVGYLGAVSTRPLQRNFRKGYERPGDLARFLVAHNPRCFKREWTREQVAETVRAIIIEETGLSDFSEDSHFIKDMHLD